MLSGHGLTFKETERVLQCASSSCLWPRSPLPLSLSTLRKFSKNIRHNQVAWRMAFTCALAGYAHGNNPNVSFHKYEVWRHRILLELLAHELSLSYLEAYLLFSSSSSEIHLFVADCVIVNSEFSTHCLTEHNHFHWATHLMYFLVFVLFLYFVVVVVVVVTSFS